MAGGIGGSRRVTETPPSVTILVGPNNAGKSLLLQEIMNQCSSGQVNSAALILDRVDFAPMDVATAQKTIEALRAKATLGERQVEAAWVSRWATENLGAPIVTPRSHFRG
jgi:ABC-type cobalamin/Fe3+-siderophores transport system ATPase subunit